MGGSARAGRRRRSHARCWSEHILRVLALVLLLGSSTWVDADDRPEEQDRPLGIYEGLLPFGVRGLQTGMAERDKRLHARTRTAIDDALGWLACHQDPGGVFDVGDLSWADGKKIPELPGTVKKAQFVTPVHALALCAFLGAGYGPHGDHAFAEPIRKGLDALARLLRVGGETNDERYVKREDPTYCMSFAFGLRALAEAFAATGDERYRSLAREVLKAILEARNAYSGWGYAYQDGRPETFLSSCIAFGIDAVVTTNRAAGGAGLDAPLLAPSAGDRDGPRVAFEGVGMWFLNATVRKTALVGYRAGGRAGTTSAAAGRNVPTSPKAAMAMADWFLQRAGVIVGWEGLASQRRVWRKTNVAETPAWSAAAPTHDLIEWWFIGMALASDPRERAKKWRASMASQLLEHQVCDGGREGLLGSWAPTGKWGFASGRVGTTALSVLCLVAPELTPVLGDPAKELPGKREDLDVKLLRRPLRSEVRADLLLALARFGADGAQAAATSHLKDEAPAVRRAARLALKIIAR